MTYLLLAIVLVVVVFVIFLYNGLVTLRNKVKEGWADIETQLKRRYDLIPNLVETVKGYAKHEEGTLSKVTELRSKAMQAQGKEERAETENMLSETLKSLFAVAENYPDLKANQNFLDLQGTLKEIEEHIQLSRRYYNGTVRDFNTKIEVVPNKFLAGPLGFTAEEFFGTKNEKERENVEVSFEKKAEPEVPTAPAEPETPAEPEAPTAPAEPETPAEPEAPTTPAEPETPAEPTPAEPEEKKEEGLLAKAASFAEEATNKAANLAEQATDKVKEHMPEKTETPAEDTPAEPETPAEETPVEPETPAEEAPAEPEPTAEPETTAKDAPTEPETPTAEEEKPKE